MFTGSGTQHGGQESTILTMIPTLLHQGMVVVGLPYTFQGLSRFDEITGGSPYGASTITKADGSRMPSDNELAGARIPGPTRGADRGQAESLARRTWSILSLTAPAAGCTRRAIDEIVRRELTAAPVNIVTQPSVQRADRRTMNERHDW